MKHLTPEFIQHEMEVFGRLETMTKAEVGALRDELRQFTSVIVAQLEESNRRCERMADRIIELAMVNRGDTMAAASHRRTMGEDSIPRKPSNTNTNMWGDEKDEDEDGEWPPKGYEVQPCP